MNQFAGTTSKGRTFRSRLARRGLVGVSAASLALACTVAISGTAHADTYERASTASISGRTITLWLNEQTGQWHGEISGASGGDRIHLDYNEYVEAPVDYDYVSTTVASGATYANTADKDAVIARACGFVGSSSNCTAWKYLSLEG